MQQTESMCKDEAAASGRPAVSSTDFANSFGCQTHFFYECLSYLCIPFQKAASSALNVEKKVSKRDDVHNMMLEKTVDCAS